MTLKENDQTSAPLLTDDQGPTDHGLGDHRRTSLAEHTSTQKASPEPVEGLPLSARLKRSPLFRTRRRTTITLLLGIPILLCAGYWLVGRIAFADVARLIALKGVVQSRKEMESPWSPATMNQVLRRKAWVRTGESSGARLLFFDTSTVDLDEHTEVSIEQVSRRRGGRSVDIVLKAWVGKTLVRAVRFVDPSSTLRVETPTASTVVRGARFTVQVEEDGSTQIDLQEGRATVRVGGEAVPLTTGERINLASSGAYETERIFEPNAQLVIDQVNAAWTAPGDAFRLELSESDVNQFLAAMDQQAVILRSAATKNLPVKDTQVWFLDGEARVATTVLKPTPFDLSASVSLSVVENQIRPRVHSVAAGVALPIPSLLIDLAIDLVMDQLDTYLAQATDLVAFEQVQIQDERLIVTGYKRAAAPGE